MTSYYDVLGVGPDADPSEVRRAYHRKARLLHPDRYVGSPDPERRRAETEMKTVNEAWRTLGNSEARRRYDAELGVIAADDDGDGWAADDEREEEHDPPRPTTRSRRGVVALAVALTLIVGVVGSVIAAVSESGHPSTGWSAAAVAELRFAALNAGLSAPQAECFVGAVTSRYSPTDPLDPAVVQRVAAACR